MKARIIKTGEIVTIIAISTEHMTIQCYGNDGIERLISLNRGDIEIIPDAEKNIDWEHRRYEIAKDILSALITARTQCKDNKSIASLSIEITDAFIKELKNKSV